MMFLLPNKPIFDSFSSVNLLLFLQILLIVTDGASNSGINKLRVPVEELRSMKVNIFSVGVGQNLNRAELEFMASDPKASHLFYVRNMAELPQLLHTLASSSCQGKGYHRGMFCTANNVRSDVSRLARQLAT